MNNQKREWYQFQVGDEKTSTYFTVGGNQDSIELAKLKCESYETRRDKRTKKPGYRIVRFQIQCHQVWSE